MPGKTVEEINDNSKKQVLNLSNLGSLYTKNAREDKTKATGISAKAGLGRSRFISGKFDAEHIKDNLGDGLTVAYDQEHLQQQMDDAQSNFSSGVNAVVGGVLSGLATAVEDLSYIPNVVTQFANNGETEEWERNGLAELMIGLKGDIADAMPLYTADENGMSFWEGVKGVTDSAIGFGIPGGIIGKTVGKGLSILGKGAKAARITARMAKYGGDLGKKMAVLSNTTAFQNAAMAIPSGLIMNDLEGTMMGMEMYDSAIREGATPEMAAQEASDFKRMNRGNAMIDMMQVSGLFGAAKGTRAMLTRKGIGADLKALTKVSWKNPIRHAIGEGVEEITQGMLQNEAIYDALRLSGKDVSEYDSSDPLARALDYGLTKEALFEGAMGFFGGGPQTFLMHATGGAYNKKSNATHNARVDVQEAFAEQFPNAVNNILNQQKKLQQLREQSKNSPEAQEVYNKASFTPLMMEAFENGTTEKLEMYLDDVANMTAEEAKEAGYENADYAEQAIKHKEALIKNEKEYIKHENNIFLKDILLEQNNIELLEHSKEIFYNKEVTETRAALDKVSTELGKQYKVTSIDGEQKVVVDSLYDPENPLTSNLTDGSQTTAAGYNAAVESSHQYKAWQVAKKNLANADNKISESNQKLNDYLDEDNQSRAEYDSKMYSIFIPQIAEVKTLDELTVIHEQINELESLGKDAKDGLISTLNTKAIAIQESEAAAVVEEAEVKALKVKKEKIEAAKVEAAKVIKAAKAAKEAQAQDTNVETTTEETTVEVTPEIEELTSSEEQRLDTEDNKQKQKAKENPTEKQVVSEPTDEDVKDAEADGIKAGRTGKSTPTGMIYDYKRIYSSFDVLGFLSRLYTRVVNGKSVSITDDTNDTLNKHQKDNKLPDFFNDAILDPKKFPRGTKVTIEEDTEYAGKVTYNGAVVDWNSIKNDPTLTEQDRIDLTPIKVTANGEVIAYIHGTEWSQEMNVAGSEKDLIKDKKSARTFRANILANGKFETIITNKSNGKFFNYADKKPRPLTEAMPDPNLTVGVAKAVSGGIINDGGKDIKVVNETLKPGVTYVVVDTHNGEKLAVPVLNSKLSMTPDSNGNNEHNKDIVDSMAMAISIYNKSNKADAETLRKRGSANHNVTNEELTKEETDFFNKLMGGETSIDLKSEEGIVNYLSKFVYVTDKGSFKENVNYIGSQPAGKSTVGYVFISNHHQQVHFSLGGNVSNSWNSDAEATDVLSAMFTQTNAKAINANEEVITLGNKFDTYKDFVKATTKTNVKSNKLESTGTYVYTIQPVVTFDTKGAQNETPKSTKTTTEQTSKLGPLTEAEVIAVSTPRKIFKDRLDRINEFLQGKRKAATTVDGNGSYVVITYDDKFSEVDGLGRSMGDGQQVLLTQEEANKMLLIAAKKKSKIITGLEAEAAEQEVLRDVYTRALEQYEIVDDAPILEIKERVDAFRKSTQQTNKTDEKADIEKRRQEELDQYAGNIVEKVEDFESIDEDGKTVYYEVTTYKNGERKYKFGYEKNKYGNVVGTNSTEMKLESSEIETYFDADNMGSISKVGERTAEESSKTRRKDKINAKYDAELEQQTNKVEDTGDGLVPGGVDIEGILGFTEDSSNEAAALEALLGDMDLGDSEQKLKDIEKEKGFFTARDNSPITFTAEQQAEVKEANKDMVIPGFSLQTQTQAVSTITDLVIKKVVEAEGVTSLKVVLKEVKAQFNALVKGASNKEASANEKKLEAINKFIIAAKTADAIANATNALAPLEAAIAADKLLQQEVIRNFQQVVDNFTRLSELAAINLESNKLVNIKTSGEEIVTEFEKTDYNSADITKDPKDSVSVEVRRFLHGLTRKDSKGKVLTNYLGLPHTANFEEVYAGLKSLLTNTKGDFKVKLATLKGSTKTVNGKEVPLYPWLPELLTKIESQDDQLKRQFTIATTQPYVNMEFMLWGIDNKGKFVIRKMNADSASKTRTLITNWKGQNRVGFLYNSEGIDYKVNEDSRKNLEKGLELLKYEVTRSKQLELSRKLFTSFGVDLTDNTLNAILDGTFEHSNKKLGLSSQFSNKNGIFNIIGEFLKQATPGTNKADLATKDLLDDGVFKSLAQHDSAYRSNVFAMSFTSEGKSVSSSSNPIFLIDRINKIKGNSPEAIAARKEVLSTSYGRNSELITALSNDTPLSREFNYSYAAFNPFKQERSSSFGDQTLAGKAEAEHEAYKLAMFGFHLGRNKGFTQFITPTNADKSGSISMLMPYQKAEYGNKKAIVTIDENGKEVSSFDKGTIQGKTLERLYNSLFLSEYNRIVAFQNRTETNNVSGHSEAAGTFLGLPELNSIEGMFKDGKINANATNVEVAVKKLIGEYVQSLVDEKLTKWEEFGIGLPVKRINKKGEEFGKVTHHTFIDNDVYEKAKNLDNLALDMVTNYLVANSEYFQVMVGDPAQFFKGQSKEQFAEKLLTATEEDIASFEAMSTEEQRARVRLKANALSVEETNAFHIANSKSTFKNITKRLASEVAPGVAPAAVGETLKPIRYLMLEDRVSTSESLDYYRLLGATEADIKAYSEIEGTDAQEFTTAEEHLDMLLMFGKINDETHARVLEQANEGTLDMQDETIKGIFQPMKPVYVNTIHRPTEDLMRRVYVKSSSFPLIPQLIKNTQLENLLETMTNSQANRAAFSTAVKVGNYKSKLNIFELDGETQTKAIRKVEKEEAEQHILTVPRDGMKIQQEVPFKDKEEINKVTQASKLILVNMLGENFNTTNLPTQVKNFLTDRGLTGENITGADLQEAYYDLYEDLYIAGRKELEAEILDDNGDINFPKLRTILVKEARSNDLSTNVINSILNDPELKYLPYSIHSDKFESLLMSLVDSRVIKQTLPGRSFVLGTEEGFSEMLSGLEGQEFLDNTAGIIYTDSYNGRLNSVGIDADGNMLPTQMFISSKLKQNDGTTLDLRELNEDGTYKWLKETIKDGNLTLSIDNDKIDPEVLRAFGMRIPNQGPNSTANMEIAGFLPESAGDLVIASRDLTVQMGSDFDIDKLYAYIKSNFINKDGKLVTLTAENKSDYINQLIKIRKEGKAPEGFDAIAVAIDNMFGIDFFSADMTDEKTQKLVDKMVLKNDIVDIHLAVASNPSNGIQKQMATPLGFGNMKEVSTTIEEFRDARGKISSAKFTGFSDQYQKEAYMNGVSGGIGISKYSNDSLFNALSQGKELALAGFSEDLPRYFNIGGKESNGALSDPYTLDGKVLKSDVISWYQSASVDNANENIMGKVNININTMAFTTAMNQLGYTDETLLITSQDIIFDYVNTINNLKSSTNTFIGDAKEEAKKIIIAKLKSEAIAKNPAFEFNATVGSALLTPATLTSMIEAPDSVSNFYDLQLAALSIFTEMTTVGEQISKLTATINADTKGMGKNLIEASYKVDLLDNIGESTILNASSLLKTDNGSKTINGLASEHGLRFGSNILNQIFPYNDKQVKAVFEAIEEIRETTDVGIAAKVEARRVAWKSMKSFMVNSSTNNIVPTNINSERKKLLIDNLSEKNGNQSLATIVQSLKEHPALADNKFFQKLSTSRHSNGKPSLISINASTRENNNEQLIYDSFLSMLNSTDDTVISTANGENHTLKTLAQDLIAYQLLIGGQQGPTDFTRYLPEAYLRDVTNLVDNLSNGNKMSIFKPVAIKTEANWMDTSAFVTQFFQHNPYLAPNTETIRPTAIGDKTIMTKNIFLRGTEKVRGYTIPTLFKLNRMGVYVRIPVLGQSNVLEFNADAESINVSINKHQNPANQKEVNGPAQVGKSRTTSDSFDNSVKEVFTFKALAGKTEGGKQLISDLLEEVANNDNLQDNDLKYVSELLLLNTHLLSDNITFVKGNNDSFSRSTNTVTLSETTLEGTRQEELLLHEVLHAFTSNEAHTYEEYVKGEEVNKEYEKSVSFKAMKSIDANRKALLKKGLDGKIPGFVVADYNEMLAIMDKANKTDQVPGMTQELQDKYYGFYNVTEFISQGTTNAAFKEVLNSTKRSDGKSWVSMLMDKINKFLGDMLGIAKEDSHLQSLVEDLVTFIQRGPDNITNEKEQLKYIETNILIDKMVTDGVLVEMVNDQTGKPCAKGGAKPTGFTKGGSWKIIKTFKGASHERGGIDITVGDGKVAMTGKQGKIEAKYGLVLAASGLSIPNEPSPTGVMGGDPKVGTNEERTPQYLIDRAENFVSQHTSKPPTKTKEVTKRGAVEQAILDNRGESVYNSMTEHEAEVRKLESQDRNINQIGGGPGRGFYQYEVIDNEYGTKGSGASKTALVRYYQLNKKYGIDTSDKHKKELLNIDSKNPDFTKLSSGLQKEIFFADKEMGLVKWDDVASGKVSLKDAYLDGHFAASEEAKIAKGPYYDKTIVIKNNKHGQ